MRILILCSSATGYAVQIIHEMKKRYPELSFSLLTYESSRKFYEKKFQPLEIENIFTYDIDAKQGRIRRHIKLFKVLQRMPQFDVIHSLWMERDWCLHAFQIKRHGRKWFLSIGGSDLFRETRTLPERLWKYRMLKRASWISGENEDTLEFFFKVFGDKYRKVRHSINSFGVDIMDEMYDVGTQEIVELKRNWKLPNDKAIVVCGYNAGEAHQHLRMIEAISRMDIKARSKMFFLFPMTYPGGREDYIANVWKSLDMVTKDYMILETFLTTKQMAEMAMISDIMIHVQTTDQLSSTMMSHMYNGNVVIAGSWLPYGQLKRRGIKFEEIDHISDLTEILPIVVENLNEWKQKYKKNKELVWEMSSWDKAAERWHDSYLGIMEV